MHGTEQIRFTELFADTWQTHGTEFAWRYYSKHGMTRVEFRLWARIISLAY
jgi:hypothetical protein